jgi:hypothetical protein
VSIYQYQFVTFTKNANIIYQVQQLFVPSTGIQISTTYLLVEVVPLTGVRILSTHTVLAVPLTGM